MKATVSAVFAGFVFGLGLVISGMTDPSKVVGFLDITGAWDPSLAFVMGGAVGVHALLYRIIRPGPRPLLASAWQIPSRHDIDLRLLGGAAIFGVGWGIGGYCPGPALVSVASLSAAPIVFVVAMSLGMALVPQGAPKRSESGSAAPLRADG